MNNELIAEKYTNFAIKYDKGLTMKSAFFYGIIVAVSVFILGLLPGMAPETPFIMRVIFALSVGFFGGILRFFVMEILFRQDNKKGVKKESKSNK